MATYETILEATVKAGVEHFGGFPPGSMIAFAGKAIPEGWLLCNGALVRRTTYARLFAAIGTAWGAGDGSTTFKLPDADGRVMQGVTDASKVGKYLEAGLPNITGGLEFPAKEYVGVNACSGVISANISCQAGYTYSAWDQGVFRRVTIDAFRGNEIFGASSSVQMASAQILMIIKV